MRRHNVIYRLFDELVQRLNQKLPKIEEEVAIGEICVAISQNELSIILDNFRY